MSTRLTATPNVAARTVAVAVAGFPAGRALEIWRDDANGHRRVRLPRGAAPDAAGGYTVTDHEAALTGTITYSVWGVRKNEIANSSFETDTAGWFGGNGSVARSTTWADSGVGSLFYTPDGSGSQSYVISTVTVPTVPGEPWVASAALRAQEAGTYRARLQYLIGGVWTFSTVWQDKALAAFSPQRLQVADPAALSGATSVRAWFGKAAGAISPGQGLFVDSVLLENTDWANPTYMAGTSNTWDYAETTLEDAARDAGPWIHAAAYPTTMAALTGGLVVDWRPSTDTGAQLVDVIGRADAIDTGPALARTRAHTVDVRCDDLAAARALEQLVTAGRTVVVRHNTAGLDTTLTVESLDGPHPDPANPRRWHVILRGREALAGPYLADPPT